jgi:hypothetical protein
VLDRGLKKIYCKKIKKEVAMARTESVIGKIEGISIKKGVCQVTVKAAKGNYPDDISTAESLWAIIKWNESPDALEGRDKTPVEKEAERNAKRKRKQEPAEGMNPPPAPPPQEVHVTVTHKMDGSAPIIDQPPEPAALTEGRDMICGECAGQWDEESSTKEEAGPGTCTLCGKESDECYFVEVK